MISVESLEFRGHDRRRGAAGWEGSMDLGRALAKLPKRDLVVLHQRSPSDNVEQPPKLGLFSFHYLLMERSHRCFKTCACLVYNLTNTFSVVTWLGIAGDSSSGQQVP